MPISIPELNPYGGHTGFGPAAYKPALALNKNRELVVVYGLGDRSDASPNSQTQAMIALREQFPVNPSDPVGHQVLWRHRFDEKEKLTGEPIIFNEAAYFTTFSQGSATDACAPGHGRIYGVHYEQADGDQGPLGNFGSAADTVTSAGSGVGATGSDSAGNLMWFELEAPGSVLRGMSVTYPPNCTLDNVGDALGSRVNDIPPSQPTLIALTGGASAGSLGNSSGSGGVSPEVEVQRLELDIDPGQNQAFPLSWSVINN